MKPRQEQNYDVFLPQYAITACVCFVLSTWVLLTAEKMLKFQLQIIPTVLLPFSAITACVCFVLSAWVLTPAEKMLL